MPMELASCAVRGRTFSSSVSSARKICMPPTFRKGSTDIAMMMIPIPPSHCRMARHRSMPGGALSNPVMTVEPVVVMPDMASKNESVMDISISLSLKGKQEKIASENHTDVISTKACFVLIFWSSLLQLRMREPPKKAVITIQKKKTFQSGLPK